MWPPIDGVRVLGITGHARAGKDTLAQMILRVVPGAERFAFSDGLAAYCRATRQMSARDPRVLQRVGMSLRDADALVWLDVLYGAIADRRPPLAVVTGVRFENEARMIREMGGDVIRVVRRNADGSMYVSDDRPNDHPAEQAVDRVVASSHVDAASGDVESLRAWARAFVWSS
jgi:hypothetical protein